MRFMWRLNSTIISSTMHIDIHSNDLPQYIHIHQKRSRRKKNFLSVERTQKIALFDFNVIISLCRIEECERNVDNNFCIYVHSFPFLLLSSHFSFPLYFFCILQKFLKNLLYRTNGLSIYMVMY